MSKLQRLLRLKHREDNGQYASYVPSFAIYDHFNEHCPYQISAVKHYVPRPGLSTIRQSLDDYRDNPKLTQVLEWCTESFGKSDYFVANAQKRPSEPGDAKTSYLRVATRCRWNHLGWNFYFKTQQDATLFKVFWG